jgi:ABC-type transport system involved in Fe-S cluster assembly fused permease/ATPase subunit
MAIYLFWMKLLLPWIVKLKKNIQNSIDSLKSNYAHLIMAHRLFTIKNIDTIFLMGHCEIVQQRNFNYLIKEISSF